MTKTLDDAREVLRTVFGYSKLKAAQEDVIRAALNGDDVLAILQTGYGKSVTFQIPAMLKPGCAVVISPLIALMKDQVDGARKRGIAASYVNSHLDADDVQQRLRDFAAGQFKLFYVAPERLGSNQFRASLAQAEINYLVVDEAHCASMWGHDFRPAYARIHELIGIVQEASEKRPAIIAVTATVTMDIEGDITKAVGMDGEYVRIVGDPVRPNLQYETSSGFSEWSAMMNVARRRFRMPGKHLVYCSTQKGAEKVADMLCEDFGDGFARFYHGGMLREERTEVQDQFVTGKLNVVAATNAFGMGIDVSDIRTVVHLGVPGSIEAYVQETGRAGRDGEESQVVLVRSDYSENLQRRFIDGSNPTIETFQTVWRWLRSVCAGGVVLRRSVEEVANHTGVDSGAVNTVLNILHGHKLIERSFYEGGAPVRLALTAATIEELRKGPVGKHLLKLARAVPGSERGTEIELSIDKTELPFELGLSQRACAKELTDLDVRNVIDVGRVFTGKTTEMLQPDADLMKVLPMERMAMKRRRDLARFQAMLDYSRLPDHDSRKSAIRNYFLTEKTAEGK